MTYTLASNPTASFINDGAQRIVYGLGDCVDTMRGQKIPEIDIDKTLMRASICVQHIEYADMCAAIDHFRLINNGTPATPYEIIYGLFVGELPRFETVWKPLLQGIQDAVDRALTNVGAVLPKETNKKQRDTLHKQRRDTWALFHRFLFEDKTTTAHNVACAQLNAVKWRGQAEVELQLIDKMRKMGHQNVARKVEAFSRLLETYSALYRDIFIQQVGNNGRAPSCPNFRWWFNIVLWTRNNKVEHEKLRNFTEKMLAYSKGNTSLIYTKPDGNSGSTSTNLSNFNHLPAVIKEIGLPADYLHVSGKARSKAGKSTLRPGYVHSHIDAVSYHGDGPTVPENGVDNAHRLNRDMTIVERQRLGVAAVAAA